MRINELPLIADFSATDYAGVDNGTATRKINLAGIINGIKTNKVDKSDALLNLDTTQAPTTTDGALYDAIDKLGWSAVISSQLMNLKQLVTKVLNLFYRTEPVTLYSQSITSTATLSDNISNYEYIEIYCTATDGARNVVAGRPYQGSVTLTPFSGSNSGSDFAALSARISINGAALTIDRHTSLHITASGITITNVTTAQIITKVLGYRGDIT